jgi:hypothetical protein
MEAEYLRTFDYSLILNRARSTELNQDETKFRRQYEGKQSAAVLALLTLKAVTLNDEAMTKFNCRNSTVATVAIQVIRVLFRKISDHVVNGRYCIVAFASAEDTVWTAVGIEKTCKSISTQY